MSLLSQYSINGMLGAMEDIFIHQKPTLALIYL